jgi:hypothetical protein
MPEGGPPIVTRCAAARILGRDDPVFCAFGFFVAEELPLGLGGVLAEEVWEVGQRGAVLVEVAEEGVCVFHEGGAPLCGENA